MIHVTYPSTFCTISFHSANTDAVPSHTPTAVSKSWWRVELRAAMAVYVYTGEMSVGVTKLILPPPCMCLPGIRTRHPLAGTDWCTAKLVQDERPDRKDLLELASGRTISHPGQRRRDHAGVKRTLSRLGQYVSTYTLASSPPLSDCNSTTNNTAMGK
jgi:hypothetical protein